MDKIVYKGFLTLAHRESRGKVYDVIMSKPAAAIALLNEDKTGLLLVRQYRPAIQQETWEIPAGMMDVDGECPLECIVRELREEAAVDLDPKRAVKLISYHPQLGSSDHLLHLYYGMVPQMFTNCRQIEGDDEVSEAKWFTPGEIDKMIADGAIVDGKTLLAIYMLATMRID
jgi:ADP-ribose pyrophosphatase